MVSRKRNKGKERKAKKAEKEVEIYRAETRENLQRMIKNKVNCNHGFDVTTILDKKVILCHILWIHFSPTWTKGWVVY